VCSAAGGGGERVLWCAIAALGDVHNLQHTKVVIYSGEPPENNDKILDRVKANFGIEIPQQIHLEFIYVPGRELLEAVKFVFEFVPLGPLVVGQRPYICCRYPRFTMLGQSLGSVIYAWNALRLYNPDVFVDTTGYAFTFLVAKLLADCQVGCYVHYPTITKVSTCRAYKNHGARGCGIVRAGNDYKSC
jgi:alpha-1,2-mannosyltransferase